MPGSPGSRAAFDVADGAHMYLRGASGPGVWRVTALLAISVFNERPSRCWFLGRSTVPSSLNEDDTYRGDLFPLERTLQFMLLRRENQAYSSKWLFPSDAGHPLFKFTQKQCDDTPLDIPPVRAGGRPFAAVQACCRHIVPEIYRPAALYL